MTRKTRKMRKDNPCSSVPIAAATPQHVTVNEQAEEHCKGELQGQATSSSLDQASDPSSPETVHDRSTSSSEHILTPTSSNLTWELLRHWYPDNVDNFIRHGLPPPPPPNWFNPFLTAPTMPPLFDINVAPPFLDPMSGLGVQPYGVMKIKNVPFGVTIAEIKSFVARLSPGPLIKDHVQGYPVHIVMERSTGKTMDCFVEFLEPRAVRLATIRAEQNQIQGKALKIAQRHVEVEVSSEGELCATLFPRAKSVRWDSITGVPTILVNEDPFSEGFQGFITVEEMSSICRQAANPQKSTFSQRCQQRVYESMISTLYKFPWHVPMHYSVNTRNFLWTAYMDMLECLVSRTPPNNKTVGYPTTAREVGLSQNLLLEYLFAGLNVQMFSLRQKMLIVQASGSLAPGFPLPQVAAGWPFEALVPAPTCPQHILDEWLNILDAGFDKVVVCQLGYRYERFVNLCRDEFGFMRFELNDAGRALTFHELISMEKGLMEILIEHGRQAWCQAWCVPYEPLNLYGGHHANLYDGSVQAMCGLSISGNTDDDRRHSPNDSGDSMGSPLPNITPGAAMPDDEDDTALKQISNEAFEEYADVGSGSGSQFDPETPAFNPNHSMIGRSPIDDANGARSADTRMQSSFNRRQISGSMSTNSVTYTSSNNCRAVNMTQTPSSTQNLGHALEGGSSEHDPFSSHVPRRASLQLGSRPDTGSPEKSVAITRSTSLKSRGALDPDRNKKYHEANLAMQAVCGNIWGPPRAVAPQTRSSSSGVTSYRLSSFGSADGNKTPERQSQSNSSTPVHTPKAANPSNGFSFSSMKTPTSQPIMQTSSGSVSGARRLANSRASIADTSRPTYAAAAARVADAKLPSPEDGHEWAVGRRRSPQGRSSATRSAVKIHATIHEEGELSTAESTDGHDDVTSDAGGVSLHADK